MKPKHFAIPAIIIFVCALGMDLWLHSIDRHHSNEPFWVIFNHILNTGLWVVIFSIIATLAGLLVMGIKRLFFKQQQ